MKEKEEEEQKYGRSTRPRRRVKEISRGKGRKCRGDI